MAAHPIGIVNEHRSDVALTDLDRTERTFHMRQALVGFDSLYRIEGISVHAGANHIDAVEFISCSILCRLPDNTTLLFLTSMWKCMHAFDT